MTAFDSPGFHKGSFNMRGPLLHVGKSRHKQNWLWKGKNI